MVQNPIEINYADLIAKPLVEHMTTLTCVSNEVGGDLAGNALWLGYPIRELLAEAKPLEGADMVLSKSHDGWTASTPLSALTDPNREAMLGDWHEWRAPCPLSMDSLCAWSSQACTGTCPRRSG